MALDGAVWEDIGGQCRIPCVPTAGFSESVSSGQQTCTTMISSEEIPFVLCVVRFVYYLALIFLYLGSLRSRLPTPHL